MSYAVVLVTLLVGLVTADFDPDLHAKSLTMPRSSFIKYFNEHNFSWKMAEYDNIQENYKSCAHFDIESMKKIPIHTHDLDAIDLPENFDARDKWPQCETIKEIYDQGQCGSCWTFGTATSASDRTCIHKDIHVRLSEQDFECNQDDVCGGGMPDIAFEYWKKQGLVTQECKPYNITELLENKCVTECVNTGINYNDDKHFADKVYRVSNDTADQIKAELVQNGPIQAGFVVFQDFLNYASGVYVHKSGRYMGRHSVRVIGYGVEDGKDYWLVANSWATKWGENGLFKIQSFQKDLEFEYLMLAGMPKN